MTSLVHANRRAVLIVSKLTMTHDRYRTKNGLFLLLEMCEHEPRKGSCFFSMCLWGLAQMKKKDAQRKSTSIRLFNLYFSLPRNFYSCEIFKRVKFFREKIS